MIRASTAVLAQLAPVPPIPVMDVDAAVFRNLTSQFMSQLNARKAA